jgi:putative tryptophan/tyrosine transport system substrate-binding protein
LTSVQRRRFVVGAAGGLLAWTETARAQQAATPVIGYLNGASAAEFPHLLAAFRKGLAEAGYAEGRNVALEYRYADGHYDRLPGLAADLVNRRVSAIVATAGTPTIRAAQAATSTIPIIFVIGSDPVLFGIVDSLSHPGGNITGVTLLGSEVAPKRLGLLLELVPTALVVGVLANPDNPISEPQLKELRAAAATLDHQLVVFKARTDDELKTAFVAIDQQRVSALLVASDPFFDDRRAQVVALAARYKVPASYVRREFVTEGGLVSYGADIGDAFRRAGLYAGRVLKGEKPAQLPVVQPTEFEMVINLKTARVLGLTIPESVLLRADEVVQ